MCERRESYRVWCRLVGGKRDGDPVGCVKGFSRDAGRGDGNLGKTRMRGGEADWEKMEVLYQRQLSEEAEEDS